MLLTLNMELTGVPCNLEVYILDRRKPPLSITISRLRGAKWMIFFLIPSSRGGFVALPPILRVVENQTPTAFVHLCSLWLLLIREVLPIFGVLGGYLFVHRVFLSTEILSELSWAAVLEFLSAGDSWAGLPALFVRDRDWALVPIRDITALVIYLRN